MRMSNLGGWMMGALVVAGIGCAPNVASRVDTPGGATEPVFRVAQGAVTFIGFDSPRSRLVAATPRNLTVWDLQRRRVVSEYPFGGNPRSRALVSGGRRLAAGFTVSGPGVQTYRTGLIDLESGRVTLLNPPGRPPTGRRDQFRFGVRAGHRRPSLAATHAVTPSRRERSRGAIHRARTAEGFAGIDPRVGPDSDSNSHSSNGIVNRFPVAQRLSIAGHDTGLSAEDFLCPGAVPFGGAGSRLRRNLLLAGRGALRYWRLPGRNA